MSSHADAGGGFTVRGGGSCELISATRNRRCSTPLLPKNRKSARVDDRKIVIAILYVLRSGMPWRNFSRLFGFFY
jgi:hypothetical protein